MPQAMHKLITPAESEPEPAPATPRWGGWRGLHRLWPTAVLAPTPGICPNCGVSLPNPQPNYCGHCGQETQLLPPTLLEFAQQFGGSYIAMEGALWRTLWRLLLWPGQLTLEYFAGRRRRYVLPLRLYLTISVLALVLLRMVTTQQLEKLPDGGIRLDTGEAQELTLELGPFQAGIHKGEFFCRNFPASACERLKRRMKMDPQALSAEIREAPARFFSHLGSAMFLMLPAYALWLKLVYIDKRRRYTEHLVYALHLHAFWFAMLIVMVAGRGLGVPGLDGLSLSAAALYPLIAMSRVYTARWWSTGLRALSLLLLYGITMTAMLTSVTIWTLMS
ncbi:DUF3667 domain-containing protein [Roseateles koreensis]|uniref:DUF3667 domain-containing protein n=1 Tax=Roseateles koreensis TaxID=2987526 RepID=A0ABT5KSI3_9BURK|nr:DUF3667 domain-containing protein [Roseateles koreensis]MDC8785889.1 DUF3667 domain-containing protein [Roseateles koreensis]